MNNKSSKTLFLALMAVVACKNTSNKTDTTLQWDNNVADSRLVQTEDASEKALAYDQASPSVVKEESQRQALGGVTANKSIAAEGAKYKKVARAKISLKKPVRKGKRRHMAVTAADPLSSVAYAPRDKELIDRDSKRRPVEKVNINPFIKASDDSLSTFAVDVDTASYTIARKSINSNQMPQANSVRVEEFVNYFSYAYPEPTGGMPFSVNMDMAPSPFSKDKHLLRVGVQGMTLSRSERKPSHLTFLVDVSGSMNSGDKLGLAKKALRVLVNNLGDSDTVSLVTYAGNTRVVLEPTSMDHKSKIMSAIEDLNASGSTAMESGLDLAYTQAAANLSSKSESRVIVLSDGDANVGNTNQRAMLKTIEGRVAEGVTLSTIGFGMGNYKDKLMEELANKGNGNYYYIDSMNEAKKVFQQQLGGTLEVIAKDVKIQVDFDKDVVEEYRLVGYENRDIADVDFRNDKVDAGEIGAGHRVTALYELKLTSKSKAPLTIRLRHKKPNGKKALENSYEFDMKNSHKAFEHTPEDFRFAVAVMATAEKLRRSVAARDWSWNKVLKVAKESNPVQNERREFVGLVEKLNDKKIAMNR